MDDPDSIIVTMPLLNNARLSAQAHWASVLFERCAMTTHSPVTGARVQVYSNEDSNSPRLVGENLVTQPLDHASSISFNSDIKDTIRIWA